MLGALNREADMNRVIIAIVAALAVALAAGDADAKPNRSRFQRAVFVKAHHCPSTGKARGACPGYVVDHIKPLCAGGSDHHSNMQWQTVADAKAKDRIERELCRSMGR